MRSASNQPLLDPCQGAKAILLDFAIHFSSVYFPSAAGNCPGISLPSIAVIFCLPQDSILVRSSYLHTEWPEDQKDLLKCNSTAMHLSHPAKCIILCVLWLSCKYQVVLFIKFVVRALGKLAKLAITELSPAPLCWLLLKLLDHRENLYAI